MEIYVNGQAHRLERQVTVAELLDRLGCMDQRVAVEVNYDIVPRSIYSAHYVQAGDKIEIVQAIGGGAIPRA